jgi:hypothetical protein
LNDLVDTNAVSAFLKPHGNRQSMDSVSKIALVIGALLAAPPAWANASIAYAKLMAVPITFDTMPAAQRDKLLLSVTVLHKSAADHTPIHMWVDDDSKRTDIPLDAAGNVTLTLQQNWVSRGLTVQTDQPTGTLDLSFNLAIQKPPSSGLTPGYLRDAVAQAQFVLDAGAHARLGFLAALVEPKVAGVKLKFAKSGQTARLATAGHQTVFVQDDAGEVAISTEALDDAPEGVLTISAPLQGLGPWIK